tara:strand:- start:6918 stop:8570 length:1653 start_codon:yes stop_codon:yes gene_type:complete
MGQSAQKQDMLSVPSGGIADFYMSDEDIAIIEQEEAQKAFGSEGVAAFDDVAKKMASYGRFGDDRIVHVESGEIVVPRALIEQSPELKESIFSHLREQGVEDPERYVVGSSANSLNPETGLPEFFLSKIVKGVKKAIGSVGKVLKKVAPVVLPIALSMTPLGPVYGAAVGSGIGTLMQGGNAEDALKNAVIAGGTGALFKGFTGKGSFGENVSAAFSDPAGRFSQTLSGDGGFFGDYKPVTAPSTDAGPFASVDTNQPPKISALESIQQTIMPDKVTTADALKQMGVNPAEANATQLEIAKEMAAEQSPGFIRRFGPSIALAGLAAGSAGFFDAPEVEEVEYDTGADLLAQNREKYGSPAEQLRYITDYNPFVPPPARREPVIQAAEGGVIGGLRGLAEYSEDVVGNLNDMMYGGQGTSGNVFNRPTLGVGFGNIPMPVRPGGETGIQPRPLMGGGPDTMLKGLGSLGSNVFTDALYAAEGGEIFPRRTGGIMPDEGVPNEDSVRAMLMPGEFVMTTDAVKGLGNGDNEQGIRKMYDMMRGLEAKGRAMA